jgi:hypothetical protein
VDFKNALIIMTSNIARPHLIENVSETGEIAEPVRKKARPSACPAKRRRQGRRFGWRPLCGRECGAAAKHHRRGTRVVGETSPHFTIQPAPGS